MAVPVFPLVSRNDKIRCTLNFDKGHEVTTKSKGKPPVCNFRVVFVFGLFLGLIGLGLLFMSLQGL